MKKGDAYSPRIPDQILHADWSVAHDKRWYARADRRAEGSYVVHSPCVWEPELVHAPSRKSFLLGFDFPIGIPLSWAKLARVRSFRSLLNRLRDQPESTFFDLAETQSDISTWRPFYPRKTGGKTRAHLIDALGVRSFDELRRRCEMPHSNRTAA